MLVVEAVPCEAGAHIDAGEDDAARIGHDDGDGDGNGNGRIVNVNVNGHTLSTALLGSARRGRVQRR
jgi:hypothetical protein